MARGPVRSAETVSRSPSFLVTLSTQIGPAAWSGQLMGPAFKGGGCDLSSYLTTRLCSEPNKKRHRSTATRPPCNACLRRHPVSNRGTFSRLNRTHQEKGARTHMAARATLGQHTEGRRHAIQPGSIASLRYFSINNSGMADGRPPVLPARPGVSTIEWRWRFIPRRPEQYRCPHIA